MWDYDTQACACGKRRGAAGHVADEALTALRDAGLVAVDRTDLAAVLGSWGTELGDQHDVDAAARLACAL
jgi:hypothetical protein